LLSAGAMFGVKDANQCAEFARRMLTDNSGRDEVILRAEQIMDANRGALDRTVELLEEVRAEQ